MDELTLRPLGIALVLGLSTGSVVFVRRQRMSALAEELGAEVAFPFGVSGPVPAAVSGGLSLFAAVLLSSGVMGFARFAGVICLAVFDRGLANSFTAFDGVGFDFLYQRIDDGGFDVRV